MNYGIVYNSINVKFKLLKVDRNISQKFRYKISVGIVDLDINEKDRSDISFSIRCSICIYTGMHISIPLFYRKW